MPSSEEINAIFDRILAGQATEADIHALRLELQQGKYRIEAEQLNANEIHIGDRIYHGADAEAIRAVLHSVLEEQQKLLEQQRAKRPRLERDFLGMVKAEVADRLKQSLHHAVLMNLGKEEQPEQVERLWDAKIKVADHPNAVLPSDTKIIEVFDREDIAGRLLILGNPGSGKTTTLLELAKALIDRAEIEPDFPMPVLFNLSSWKDNNQPLHEWMVQELKLRGVRSDITRKWLDKRKLLPMLDGLDEMKPDRQETCVEAINKQILTGEKSLPYLVVCSRNEEYDNYEIKLLLNGAIYIQELTIDKIQSYLDSVDQTELCHAIDRDSELLALVRTPLFLSIASLAFQELSYERWQILATTEARIEHLLDAYIRQILEQTILQNLSSKQQLPPNQKTRKWLAWLAQQMERESQSEFLIEKMQPTWLQNTSQQNFYSTFALLLAGTLSGFWGGLSFGITLSLAFLYKYVGILDIRLILWLFAVLVFGFLSGLVGALIVLAITFILCIFSILLISTSTLIFLVIVRFILRPLLIFILPKMDEEAQKKIKAKPTRTESHRAKRSKVLEIKTFEVINFSIENIKDWIWEQCSSTNAFVFVFGFTFWFFIFFASFNFIVYGLIKSFSFYFFSSYWFIEILIRMIAYGMLFFIIISLGESVQSWKEKTQIFIVGIFFALGMELFSGLINQLIIRLIDRTVNEFFIGLVLLVLSLIKVFSTGFKALNKEARKIPNQGIWMSLTNACIIAPLSAVITIAVFGISFIVFPESRLSAISYGLLLTATWCLIMNLRW